MAHKIYAYGCPLDFYSSNIDFFKSIIQLICSHISLYELNPYIQVVYDNLKDIHAYGSILDS